jgi:NCS1 family nucleobase:cation symporter-1
LQAVAAYVIGIALPFPGFCGELGANVSAAAAHIMDLAWILSFTASFIVYFIMCSIWPTQNMRYVKEKGYTFEQVAPDGACYEPGLEKDEVIVHVGPRQEAA